jgi:hypothetical protein
MSIRITDTSNPTSWAYQHDDAPPELGGPHGGMLDPAIVVYATDPHTGQVDYDLIVTPCPFSGCGSASWHPVSGGADPLHVQQLSVRLAMRDRKMNAQQAINDVKQRCERMDGPGRWQVDESALLKELGE